MTSMTAPELIVKDCRYHVETPGPGTVRLTKQCGKGETYTVAREGDLITCTCPDYLHRHAGIVGAMCKHGKAAKDAGLIDFPAGKSEPVREAREVMAAYLSDYRRARESGQSRDVADSADSHRAFLRAVDAVASPEAALKLYTAAREAREAIDDRHASEALDRSYDPPFGPSDDDARWAAENLNDADPFPMPTGPDFSEADLWRSLPDLPDHHERYAVRAIG